MTGHSGHDSGAVNLEMIMHKNGSRFWHAGKNVFPACQQSKIAVHARNRRQKPHTKVWREPTISVITISGVPGSGKSTVAKKLAEKLNYKHYSVGDLMGRMAQEMGITLHELGLRCENDPDTDKKLDEYQTKLAEEEDSFVIDSRLGFHFIPDSVKVYLTVDSVAGAKRIMNADRSERLDEPEYKSVKDVMRAVKRRMKSERIRYRKYYNLDIHSPKNYDIVIDTTELTPDQVVDGIMERIDPLQKNIRRKKNRTKSK